MSRLRLLADHDLNDLNEQIIDGVLRKEPAVEFARVHDFQLESADDKAVLEYAALENWVVVSHDVNTMTAAASRLIESKVPMAGLIMVHQVDPVSIAIENLVLIWSASEREEWKDQVVFLPL